MTAVTLQETKCSDSILHVNNLQRQTYTYTRGHRVESVRQKYEVETKHS